MNFATRQLYNIFFFVQLNTVNYFVWWLTIGFCWPWNVFETQSELKKRKKCGARKTRQVAPAWGDMFELKKEGNNRLCLNVTEVCFCPTQTAAGASRWLNSKHFVPLHQLSLQTDFCPTYLSAFIAAPLRRPSYFGSCLRHLFTRLEFLLLAASILHMVLVLADGRSLPRPGFTLPEVAPMGARRPAPAHSRDARGRREGAGQNET